MIVAEAGAGIALLTMVFAYLPVIYQSFSRREVRLTLLERVGRIAAAAAEVLRACRRGRGSVTAR